MLVQILTQPGVKRSEPPLCYFKRNVRVYLDDGSIELRAEDVADGVALKTATDSAGDYREFRVWPGQYGKEGDVPWPDARNPGSPMLSSTSC